MALQSHSNIAQETLTDIQHDLPSPEHNVWQASPYWFPTGQGYPQIIVPKPTYSEGSPSPSSSLSALSTDTPYTLASSIAQLNTSEPSTSLSEVRCHYKDCTSKSKFKRRTDLDRHIRTHHEADKNRIDCEYGWCGRKGKNGFSRRDHLRDHLREVHRQEVPLTRGRRRSSKKGKSKIDSNINYQLISVTTATTTSLPQYRPRVQFCHDFVSHLAQELSTTVTQYQSQSKLIQTLNAAIGTCAFRSRFNGSGDIAAEWVLLEHYSSVISQVLLERLIPNQNEDAMDVEGNSLPITAKIHRWYSQDQGFTAIEKLASRLDEFDFSAVGRLEFELKFDAWKLQGSKDFFRSSLFSWLTVYLRRELSCDYPDDNVMKQIEDEVCSPIHATDSEGLSSNAEMLDVFVMMDWDLNGFILAQSGQLQGLGISKVIDLDTLGDSVTLTGSARDAQVLTCLEYLDSVWPHLGSGILEMVRIAAQDSRKNSYTQFKPFHDIARIHLRFLANELRVELSGKPYPIAEVLQILAWLSSAFRATTDQASITTCLASIHCTDNNATYAMEPNPMKRYQIRYRIEKSSENGPGNCWRSMLHNPTIVKGFPTRRRTHTAEIGLEIDVPMIASLLHSTKVVVLNGLTYLRSFSSILVPTARTPRMIIWHYIFNPGGSYIPLQHAESIATIAVHLKDMIHLRHVIGWCSEATINVGAPSGVCDISRPDLERTRSSIAFKSFTLSAGHFVNAGVSVAFGVKDLPLRVPPAGLGILDEVAWMEDKFVVFWDTKDRRGWLVDGVSALLHMLRASLRALHSSSLLRAATKKLDIYEPSMPYPEAAFEFFSGRDQQNLGLELYLRRFEIKTDSSGDADSVPTKIKSATSVLLQDRLEHLWEILAYMMVQHEEASRREGIFLKPELRQALEGWDFVDVVTHQTHFEPLRAKMDCFSEPWVHFIRSINAVVLFGEGFGELIQPSKRCTHLCSHWQTLPTNKDYLATTYSTIKMIQRRHGRRSDGHMEISKGYLWYNSNGVFESSPCMQDQTDLCSKAVQIIWPISIFDNDNVKRYGHPELQLNSAIVFGRNESLSWWQDINGRFLRGKPPPQAKSNGKGKAKSSKLKSPERDNSSITHSPSASQSSGLSKDADQTESTDSTEATEMSLVGGAILKGKGKEHLPSSKSRKIGLLAWLLPERFHPQADPSRPS